MDERPPWERSRDDKDAPRTTPGASDPSDATEGVRIIGAEEAAEALERGDVASRRPEGVPRYGDRPPAPPGDVKPTHRFPSSSGVEPHARPKVSGASPAALPPWTDPPTGEVPSVLQRDDAEEDLEAWSGFAGAGPRWRDTPGDWEEPDYDETSMLHDDETRVGALDSSERAAPDDYLGLDDDPLPPPPQRPRARPAPEPPLPIGRDGEEVPTEAVPVTGSTARSNAAQSTGTGRMPADDPPVVRTGGGGRTRTPRPAPEAAGASAAADRLGGRDLRTAIVTGVVLAVVAGFLFLSGPGYAMVIVTAVIGVCAAELFAALQRGGYLPATLLGLVASVSLVLAAYWRGEAALPLVLALTVVATLLWYVIGVSRSGVTMNVGVSLFGVLYVGLLGSFAALILALFPNGTGVLMAAIAATVANDIGAFFVGRSMGKAKLAPDVSPNKTVEGLAGGALASVVVVVAVFGIPTWQPWSLGSALGLGLLVAVVAPLGDLCESLIKRDIGVKDMGSVLPGHGGLLDRFDALLFVLPATYYYCRLVEVF